MDAGGRRPGVMRPEFGCIIWDLLYEPFTDEIYEDIVENITDIGNNDPRLQLQEIEPLQYEHGIQVSLILKYIPTDQTEQMLFTFNKEASTVTANTGTANGY